MKSLVSFYEIFFDALIMFFEKFVLHGGNLEHKNIGENIRNWSKKSFSSIGIR